MARIDESKIPSRPHERRDAVEPGAAGGPKRTVASVDVAHGALGVAPPLCQRELRRAGCSGSARAPSPVGPVRRVECGLGTAACVAGAPGGWYAQGKSRPSARSPRRSRTDRGALPPAPPPRAQPWPVAPQRGADAPVRPGYEGRSRREGFCARAHLASGSSGSGSGGSSTAAQSARRRARSWWAERSHSSRGLISAKCASHSPWNASSARHAWPLGV
jgi:hypothetical protein